MLTPGTVGAHTTKALTPPTHTERHPSPPRTCSYLPYEGSSAAQLERPGLYRGGPLSRRQATLPIPCGREVSSHTLQGQAQDSTERTTL